MVADVPKVRKPSKPIVSTYVVHRKSTGGKSRYKARIIDRRTSTEVRCTGETVAKAAECARERAGLPRR